MSEARVRRGRSAHAGGLAAEGAACLALAADGWEVLGRRVRTGAGEVDIVARRDRLLAFVEVKARPSLMEAAYALTPRQSRRLLLAASAALADHPEWDGLDIRFDVMLVDRSGRVRRVADAIRADETGC